MKFIKDFLQKHFFKNEYDKYSSEVMAKHIQTEEKRDHERKIEIAEFMVGTPVICISNQWCNPAIGFVKRIECITQANQPIPVIFDVLTQQELLCFGVIYDFTYQRLRAFLKLDPEERWSLMIKYSHQITTFTKPTDKASPLSLTETLTVLQKTGFDLEFSKFKLFQEEPKVESEITRESSDEFKVDDSYTTDLTHMDDSTLNGEPEDFFIEEESKEQCLQRLYEYLKTQFHDVETAKAFMKKWNHEWNQELRGFDPGPNDMNDLTQRAMAYHVCYVLEGEVNSTELYFACLALN